MIFKKKSKYEKLKYDPLNEQFVCCSESIANIKKAWKKAPHGVVKITSRCETCDKLWEMGEGGFITTETRKNHDFQKEGIDS